MGFNMEKIFLAKIEWYNEFEEQMTTDSVIVMAHGWEEATSKIIKQYGETLETIKEMTVIGENYVIILGTDNEKTSEICDSITNCNMF